MSKPVRFVFVKTKKPVFHLFAIIILYSSIDEQFDRCLHSFVIPKFKASNGTVCITPFISLGIYI